MHQDLGRSYFFSMVFDNLHRLGHQLPRQSLGYLLADAGFDVWLGNVRGNTYGRQSAETKADFWNFSFDEMATLDLPAMINKALEVSGADRLVGTSGIRRGTAMDSFSFLNDRSGQE